jgi:outer membrane protein assembly factor BamB
MRTNLRFTLPLMLLMFLSSSLAAGDWPQILGPNRDGVAGGEKLLLKWPDQGPASNWTHTLGDGFGGVAVAGTSVIAYHRINDKDHVECIDAVTGKTRWRTSYNANYRGGANPDLGPRCVPLIHQGHVYTFSADGDLHCLALKDGARVWSRETYGDFDGDEGYFGAAATPIVAGGNLLVNIGGKDNAGLVAFNLLTGKTRWQATAEAASYSSPTLATLGGRQHAVFVTRLNVIAVDPENGKTAFQFPFGRRGPTVNAATPLIIGDHLFVTASYQIGARMVKLPATGSKVTEVWANDETLSSQYSTGVHHQGHIYGFHGREDIGRASLRCVEVRSGKVAWSQDDLAVGHIVRSKDLLLILSVEGTLTLVKASSESYQKLAEAQATRGTTRALPALSNGRLLVRTSSSQANQLICLQVGE